MSDINYKELFVGSILFIFMSLGIGTFITIMFLSALYGGNTIFLIPVFLVVGVGVLSFTILINKLWSALK